MVARICSRARLVRLTWLMWLAACGVLSPARSLELSALGDPVLWQRLDLRVDDVPPATNRYDPDLLAVDAAFTLPGGTTLTVPAFWLQHYQRTLRDGTEVIEPIRLSPEWRVRFTPTEPGTYTATATVRTQGVVAATSAPLKFTLPPPAPTAPVPATAGYVRVAANGRFFETTLGAPLPLFGANVCWHGRRGTYDYDDWFAALAAAGQNFARLWMCPWAFGLEADPGTRLNYRQDRAWQLDYVFALAEAKGIRLLLCLDYHGMFQTEPDSWGGNNYWPQHPYQTAQGGPCTKPNDFFTHATARVLYQKRLRYLIARYGYSPSLLAWEFFNEIDNVYPTLVATDVAAWHDDVARWLHARDPFPHLVTTSLTGGSDRSELWRLPSLDFAAYHSYGLTEPAANLPAVAEAFRTRYGKPMMIGEYGVDWRGWARASDPHLRGLRQALWAGALGGSVGSSMSWWWEHLHDEKVWPMLGALREFARPTSLGAGAWEPLRGRTAGDPPITLAEPPPAPSPFSATLPLNPAWAVKLRGQMAIADAFSASLAGNFLNSFVHGTSHADLRLPFQVQVWTTNDAQLVLHLNSVSSGALLSVRVNGTEALRRSLPNKDGGWNVNREYDEDIAVPLPAGKLTLEVRNLGQDWFYLDWLRIDRALPAAYAGGWQPAPIAFGLRGETDSLLYLVSPYASWPAHATNAAPPLLQGQTVTVPVPHAMAGTHRALWFDPATGQSLTETAVTSVGDELTLVLPDFRDDLAVRVVAAPRFALPRLDPQDTFRATLLGLPGDVWTLETSSTLAHWTQLERWTNTTGALGLADPTAGAVQRFYRARVTLGGAP